MRGRDDFKELLRAVAKDRATASSSER